MAINPAAFGDPDAIRKHFSEYLEALRESPKADGQDRIYTHGEKEVAAEKDRKENGIPVNDNTMVELADLCSYLKLDFGVYFEGYELPKDSRFFNGNINSGNPFEMKYIIIIQGGKENGLCKRVIKTARRLER